jgi:hypothetical protein
MVVSEIVGTAASWRADVQKLRHLQAYSLFDLMLPS